MADEITSVTITTDPEITVTTIDDPPIASVYLALSVGYTIVENETPSGTINGVNADFVLTHTPITNSLMIIKNGVFQTQDINYSLSSATITFIGDSIPDAGSVIRCFYRYA